MREKFFPFVYGFVLTLGVILAASWYFSKPAKLDQPDLPVVDENGLDQLKQSISALNNFGDLPKSVDAGSVGKTNPFE